MAYSIPSDSIVQVTFEGKHDGQQVLTVWSYKLTAGGPLTDGRTELGKLRTSILATGKMLDKWQACLSEQVSNITCRFQWVAPERFAAIFGAPFIDVGSVAGDSFPSNVAVALTRGTDLAGRAQVGTIHMPGVPSTFLVEGAVSAAGLTPYSDLLTESLLTISPASSSAVYSPVHYHRTAPTTAQPLTTSRVQSFSRVMRRRTVGLGS